MGNDLKKETVVKFLAKQKGGLSKYLKKRMREGSNERLVAIDTGVETNESRSVQSEEKKWESILYIITSRLKLSGAVLEW